MCNKNENASLETHSWSNMHGLLVRLENVVRWLHGLCTKRKDSGANAKCHVVDNARGEVEGGVRGGVEEWRSEAEDEVLHRGLAVGDGGCGGFGWHECEWGGVGGPVKSGA